jgi:hypothetical protein
MTYMILCLTLYNCSFIGRPKFNKINVLKLYEYANNVTRNSRRLRHAKELRHSEASRTNLADVIQGVPMEKQFCAEDACVGESKYVGKSPFSWALLEGTYARVSRCGHSFGLLQLNSLEGD